MHFGFLPNSHTSPPNIPAVLNTNLSRVSVVLLKGKHNVNDPEYEYSVQSTPTKTEKVSSYTKTDVTCDVCSDIKATVGDCMARVNLNHEII